MAYVFLSGEVITRSLVPESISELRACHPQLSFHTSTAMQERGGHNNFVVLVENGPINVITFERKEIPRVKIQEKPRSILGCTCKRTLK